MVGEKILMSIMEAIIPPGGAFENGATDKELMNKFQLYRKSLNPAMGFGFPFLILFIQFNAIFHRGLPFTMLNLKTRSNYLAKFEHSIFYHRRIIILALKMVTMLTFYDDDKNAAQIGYTHIKNFKR